MNYLKELDKRLRTVKEKFDDKYDKTLEFIMVSDHGNYYEAPKAIEFEKVLKEKGFHLKKTLKEKKDYAFDASEIIAFAPFYALPKQEIPLAKALAQVPHIHVALVHEKNKVLVFSHHGESEIAINKAKQTVSYRVLLGKDPFDQIQFFKKKKTLSWQEYFFKTLETPFPNALVRAWTGFEDALVPGSVLVSPQLGYVFTNPTLEVLTALSGVHSSHGSFARQESLGVVLSTTPLSYEAITPHQFQDLLKETTEPVQTGDKGHSHPLVGRGS
jgi:hypothetical protein